MKPITIATEDELSENVARKLISHYTDFSVVQTLRRGGFGYLKTNLKNFFELSLHTPVFLMVDLDKALCAPTLVQTWKNTVNIPQPDDMLFRVAVRETEAWILADNENCGKFLNVKNIPQQVDDLPDPKQALLNLAKKASRDVRRALVAQEGSIAIQGLEYNRYLSQFVMEAWDPDKARLLSGSLNKTCERLIQMNLRIV